MGTISRIITSFTNGTFLRKLFKHSVSSRRLFYLKDDGIRREQQNLIVYRWLKKHYGYVLDEEIPEREREHSDKIWTCWFQGMENAPLLCQIGSSRFQQVFGKDNVMIMTAENIGDYLELPEYILEKWKKGIISNTHFSDIIRYCLLYEYGGTWIDSTILILDEDLPDYFHDSRLFLFADYISGTVPNIQSSYISAYSHSRLIGYVRELIFEYWKNENYTLDYNMYHMFFQMAEEKCPEEWKEVYQYPNHATHILRKDLFDPFDQKRYDQIRKMCPVQKLSHKKHPTDDVSGTFYDVLIEHGREFFKMK